jgi:7-keto-8-aminopelargonate synthetase-like enzyme
MSGVPAVLNGDRLLRRFYTLADAARGRGLSRRVLEDLEFHDGCTITLDGAKLLNLTSCSYLGLNTDERLKEGAIDAVQRFGTCYSSSPAYSALPMYRELTEAFEDITGSSVLLAPTTTLAHLAALPLLARPRDAVVVDAHAHASVQTALEHVRSAGIPVHTAPHGDTVKLREMVDRVVAETRNRVWYVADGVYSMQGDLAPLAFLNEILDEYPSLHAYIDDAHGFSWTGRHGRGPALEALGTHDRVVVAFGLAKSFGTTGGVIASANRELVDLIELCGGPLSFGGPVPPAVLGASMASAQIHLSDEHHELSRELIARILAVNEECRHLGIPLASEDLAPIRFVPVGSTERMFTIVEAMKRDGFYVNGAMFPIVPQGHEGVRFTVGLNVEQIDMFTMLERLAVHVRATSESDVVIDLTESARLEKHQPRKPSALP